MVKRKKNFKKFVFELINLKQFTTKQIERGIENEPVALEAYIKLTFTRNTAVKVLNIASFSAKTCQFLATHLVAKLLILDVNLVLWKSSAWKQSSLLYF